jgi:hypothetical protein
MTPVTRTRDDDPVAEVEFEQMPVLPASVGSDIPLPASLPGQPAYPSRPCQVVMQASFPSGSASTQNAGASAS